ncbi:MAG: PAS domain-containing protein [Zetaproteobacteria bacterium]|nr:MAG: PAS domain-containing protein [Zetaproteobacteria bacterium]
MSVDLSLFDHVQEGVVVADAGLVVRHWNSVIARWSGIDPSDAVGRPLIALAPKLEDDRYRRPVEAVIARGSPVTFSAAIHHYIIPCPGKEPGEFRQQDTVVCPLPVDGATMALFSVVDRTDHIANLRGLQQANVKLRRTVRLRRESDRINMMLAAGMDNAAEAILVVDHRGRLEYANPMFYRLAQLEIPSVKGQLLTEILRTDQGGAAPSRGDAGDLQRRAVARSGGGDPA